MVLVGVRSGRELEPQAQPTPSFSETPLETLSPSETPSPAVTMTFTGVPPFETKSPTAPRPSPTLTGLPTTGVGGGGELPMLLIMLVLSVAAGVSMARAG